MSEERTESLCPVCFARIPARRETEGDAVYQRKRCPEHGDFRSLLWKGPPAFEAWKRPKVPARPPFTHTEADRGCPFDCGLCPNHRQRSCTVLMEVTSRCDLRCPVCYADSGRPAAEDPGLEVLSTWYERIATGGKTCNIQLSGGEPATRDDLPDIVALGRRQGFPFIQVNTNGIRLGEDPAYTRALKAAGLSSVFLQFDGTEEEIHLRIRGRRLLEAKRKAVEACAEHGLGVVLVPTVVPGVNDHNLGDILRQAVLWSPAVRGVHFQPISYFGRYPQPPRDEDRITLPEVMRALEKQSGGLCRVTDFRPPGCENALCSFHGHYLALSDGTLKSLQPAHTPSCCAAPESAEEGATKAISYVARQWASAPPAPPSGTDETSSGLISIEEFLNQARSRTFSVSAMAFQDAWTVDLERVRDCCIHVLTPRLTLVPFCAYNLTSVDGRPLHRS